MWARPEQLLYQYLADEPGATSNQYGRIPVELLDRCGSVPVGWHRLKHNGDFELKAHWTTLVETQRVGRQTSTANSKI